MVPNPTKTVVPRTSSSPTTAPPVPSNPGSPDAARLILVGELMLGLSALPAEAFEVDPDLVVKDALALTWEPVARHHWDCGVGAVFRSRSDSSWMAFHADTFAMPGGPREHRWAECDPAQKMALLAVLVQNAAYAETLTGLADAVAARLRQPRRSPFAHFEHGAFQAVLRAGRRDEAFGALVALGAYEDLAAEWDAITQRT